MLVYMCKLEAAGITGSFSHHALGSAPLSTAIPGNKSHPRNSVGLSSKLACQLCLPLSVGKRATLSSQHRLTQIAKSLMKPSALVSFPSLVVKRFKGQGHSRSSGLKVQALFLRIRNPQSKDPSRSLVHQPSLSREEAAFLQALKIREN